MFAYNVLPDKVEYEVKSAITSVLVRANRTLVIRFQPHFFNVSEEDSSRQGWRNRKRSGEGRETSKSLHQISRESST